MKNISHLIILFYSLIIFIYGALFWELAKVQGLLLGGIFIISGVLAAVIVGKNEKWKH